MNLNQEEIPGISKFYRISDLIRKKRKSQETSINKRQNSVSSWTTFQYYPLSFCFLFLLYFPFNFMTLCLKSLAREYHLFDRCFNYYILIGLSREESSFDKMFLHYY